jgi:hypothetical protein
MVLLPCETLLSTLPEVQCLDLGLLADTSSESLEALRGMSRLTFLSLGGSTSEGGFRVLGGLTSLVELRILGGRNGYGQRYYVTSGMLDVFRPIF